MIVSRQRLRVWFLIRFCACLCALRGQLNREPSVTDFEWEVLRYCDVFKAGAPVEQAPEMFSAEADEARKVAEREAARRREMKRLRKKLKREAKKKLDAEAAAKGGNVRAF